MKMLRNSIHKIDKELSGVSMLERLRTINESSFARPSIPKLAQKVDVVTQMKAAHVTPPGGVNM